MNSFLQLQKYSFSHLSRIFLVASASPIYTASNCINTFIPKNLNTGSKPKYINAIKVISTTEKPITNIAIIYGKNTPPEPGYEKIALDLN
jgi:hypothetical protein